MKKRIIIFSILFVMLNIIVNFNNKHYSITNYQKIKFSGCPASGEVCTSNGYNILCQMSSPLKNPNITSEVCSSTRSSHYGIDLTSSDKNVTNAIEGIVIDITTNNENCGWTNENGCGTCANGGSSKGNSVTIQGTGIYAGYTVQYMHLSKINEIILSYYNSGSKEVVKKGDLIGIYGNTGCSSGAHLHFQVTDPSNNIVNTNAFFKDKSSIVCGIPGYSDGIYSDGIYSGTNVDGSSGKCTSYVSSSSFSQINADKILANARQYLGQGEAEAGYCSGFVRNAYLNISSLPGAAAIIAQSNSNKCVHFNDIKPGDLFFTSRLNSNGSCTNCVSSTFGNRCDRWGCIMHVGIVESVSSNGIVTIIDNIRSGVSSRKFQYNLSPNDRGTPWFIMVVRPYAKLSQIVENEDNYER